MEDRSCKPSEDDKRTSLDWQQETKFQRRKRKTKNHAMLWESSIRSHKENNDKGTIVLPTQEDTKLWSGVKVLQEKSQRDTIFCVFNH